MLFADMAPELASRPHHSSVPGQAKKVVPAEAAPDPATQGPDMSWWEGPLDRVMGRKVDGKTSYTDATELSLSEVSALIPKAQ